MDALSSLKLDPLTLMFSVAWMALLMGLLSFGLARAQPEHRLALHAWGAGMVANGVALGLVLVRGWVSPWLSDVVANLLLLAAAHLALLATARLLQCPMPRRTPLLAWPMGSTVALSQLSWGVSHRLALLALTLALAGLLLRTALLILLHWRRQAISSGWINIGLLATMGATLAWRALRLLGDDGSAAPAAHAGMQIGVLMMAGALFIVGASLGFFFMVQDRQRREAKELARRDLLTGLYTRAGFFELAEAVDRAQPAAHYAIVMVDIDHFKAINDTHGHTGGDLALAHAARLIANTVRISDIAGRYGGEEFCLLLKGCAEADVAGFAERLVREAGQQTVRLGDGRSTGYTLSVGYACRSVGNSGQTPEPVAAVIERADQALYAAKRSGRNRALPAAQPGAAPAWQLRPA